MGSKTIKHFPETVLTIISFLGFWPRNDEYVTVLHTLQVALFFTFCQGWIFLGAMLYLFANYNNPRIEVTDSVLVLFTGLFFIYGFAMYFTKVNRIIDFLKDVDNVDKFEEPGGLQAFKRKHNNIVKFLTGYVVVAILIYAVASYLDGKSCEKRNRENHKSNICGLVVPLWAPVDMDSYGKNVVFILEVFTYWIILLSALTLTYFFVVCYDTLVVRLKHLKHNLEGIPELTKKMRTETLIRCIKYHIKIISLTQQCNDCFGDINKVHFSLSSIILGILNNQTITEHQLKVALHLLGWIATLYLLCNIGQHLINESTAISRTLYFLNWYDYDSEQNFYLRMMMMRAQQPLSISTGIFYSYSMEMFSMILRASYTYMTVIANLRYVIGEN